MAESINLQKCTKEELLFLIDRMRHYNVGDNLFRFARRDLVNERLMQRERLAQEQAEIAHDARMKYVDLLKQYEGAPIEDIPTGVFNQAQALLIKAIEADKKWVQLVGMDTKEREKV